MAIPSVIRVDNQTWVSAAQVHVIKEVGGGAVELLVDWQDKPLRVEPEFAGPILKALKAG